MPRSHPYDKYVEGEYNESRKKVTVFSAIMLIIQLYV